MSQAHVPKLPTPQRVVVPAHTQRPTLHQRWTCCQRELEPEPERERELEPEQGRELPPPVQVEQVPKTSGATRAVCGPCTRAAAVTPSPVSPSLAL